MLPLRKRIWILVFRAELLTFWSQHFNRNVKQLTTIIKSGTRSWMSTSDNRVTMNESSQKHHYQQNDSVIILKPRSVNTTNRRSETGVWFVRPAISCCKNWNYEAEFKVCKSKEIRFTAIGQTTADNNSLEYAGVQYHVIWSMIRWTESHDTHVSQRSS